MTLRMIEVSVDQKYTSSIEALAERVGVIQWHVSDIDNKDQRLIRLLVGPRQRQHVMDDIQKVLSGATGWHIVMLPVEAVVVSPETPEEEEQAFLADANETREELYGDIAKGAQFSTNFVVFAILSTIVAAIGLISDNVAVVIGAMVIAPLLGPNLAFAFGTSLGDRDLMRQSMLTNLAGVSISITVCIIAGRFWPGALDSHELMTRTIVGYDGIALALASGAAAALSLTTGLSSALVGVMVAVALLPPAATAGLMLGAGQYHYAVGAVLLLSVNVVCVNLAAQLAFLARRIRPRMWFEKKSAAKYITISLIFWTLLLAGLMTVIKVRS